MKKISVLFLIGWCSVSLAQDTIWHERIYLGTGEYSPMDDWHGLLRFDFSENYDSEPGAISYIPHATIPVKQCYAGSVMLNFGHGLYYHEEADRMYLTTIFTNQNNIITNNPDTAVGSIAIFDGISILDGGLTPTRHIFGTNTQLKQPHASWLDESRDMLYVANAFARNILVFENASAADGNISPNRVISHDSLGAPVYIFIDESVDRMFVTAMPNGIGTKSEVFIYNNASTLNGTPDPAIRISGQNTRLNITNSTVHNCWWNPNNQLLAVGHHTNELLFFELSGVNWSPASTQILDLVPRVLRVDDPALGYDSTDVNLYGFYWDLQTDRLFCSVGIDNLGGGPASGAPPNSIKVYNNVGSSTVQGIVQPDRIIYWENGNAYYPPQPIWLQKYYTVNTGIQDDKLNNEILIYPNPATNNCTVEFLYSIIQDSGVEIILRNPVGQIIYKKVLNVIHKGDKIILNNSLRQSNLLFLNITSDDLRIVKKVIIY